MVRHLAFSGTMRRIFFGIAALLTASTAALAQTTTLVCNLDPSNAWKEVEPTTIELNDAQGYIVIHYAARTLSLNGDRAPARSSGPLPAVFGTDKITASSNGYNDVIDRVTGIFIDTAAQWSWTCQAGKPQF